MNQTPRETCSGLAAIARQIARTEYQRGWRSVNRLAVRRLNAASRRRHTADRRAYDHRRYLANREAIIARNRRYDAQQAAERDRLGAMLVHLGMRYGCTHVIGAKVRTVYGNNGRRQIVRA